MFEAGNAGLDVVIDKTIAQLTVYRQHHDDQDENFIRGLVRSFVDQAARSQHGAGAITMGLSAYRMAIQQLEIERLEKLVDHLRERNEMQQAALDFMWATADEEEVKGD